MEKIVSRGGAENAEKIRKCPIKLLKSNYLPQMAQRKSEIALDLDPKPLILDPLTLGLNSCPFV